MRAVDQKQDYHLEWPIVTANDKRKQTAVPGSHNPGLCMAVAILLKERNREMCGLQSIISPIILFTCG